MTKKEVYEVLQGSVSTTLSRIHNAFNDYKQKKQERGEGPPTDPEELPIKELYSSEGIKENADDFNFKFAGRRYRVKAVTLLPADGMLFETYLVDGDSFSRKKTLITELNLLAEIDPNNNQNVKYTLLDTKDAFDLDKLAEKYTDKFWAYALEVQEKRLESLKNPQYVA